MPLINEPLDGVGDLELASRRGLDGLDRLEDRRVEHVDADQCEVGRRTFGFSMSAPPGRPELGHAELRRSGTRASRIWLCGFSSRKRPTSGWSFSRSGCRPGTCRRSPSPERAPISAPREPARAGVLLNIGDADAEREPSPTASRISCGSLRQRCRSRGCPRPPGPLSRRRGWACLATGTSCLAEV